jgi:myo-inositol-1(or 4)-monophosphatase
LQGNEQANPDRAGLRDRLAAIVREAGDIALTAAKGPLKRWTKEGSSPVSEADIAVNDFLATRLPPLAPDAGWLSEETEDNSARTGANEVWVVDPIDGTRAYLDRRPDWTISVALVEGGRPTLAALYAPVTNEMFVAVRGGGATLNGGRLKVQQGDGLNGARFAGPLRFLNKLAEINPGVLPQPKVHSLALRFARVAGGDLEAAFASRNSHDWDLAAADLLVHEAGGLMTDFAGQTLRYNRADTTHGALIAAGPGRHGELIDLLRDRASEFA